MSDKSSVSKGNIKVESLIVTIRKQRVIVDADLARLYGVKTYHLNQQVRRNKQKFPLDFMFELTKSEKDELITNCDRFKNLKHSSALPHVFTEHGAIMAANVLNSQIAIDTSIMVVRVFIRAREVISEHADLKCKLDDLERKIAKKFSDNEAELMEIRFAIQQLMLRLEKKEGRPLGFGRNE